MKIYQDPEMEEIYLFPVETVVDSRFVSGGDLIEVEEETENSESSSESSSGSSEQQ